MRLSIRFSLWRPISTKRASNLPITSKLKSITPISNMTYQMLKESKQKLSSRSSRKRMRYCLIQSQDRRMILRISLMKDRTLSNQPTKTPCQKVTTSNPRLRLTSTTRNGQITRSQNGTTPSTGLTHAVNTCTEDRQTSEWILTLTWHLTSSSTIDSSCTLLYSDSSNCMNYLSGTWTKKSRHSRWKYYRLLSK